MAPLESWERVWIDKDLFGEDVHSYINCTQCHHGESVDDYDLAHDGLVTEVVTSPEVCGDCHVDNGLPAYNSLHNTLSGYDTALYARSVPENHDAIEEMEAMHCNSCHATCGDCHVSQPSSVGGGLLDGHDFIEKPSMARNCTACHGSRIKNEYYGSHDEIPSDVHFRARMDCMECHTADEMHGKDMEDVAHRYEGEREPRCETCHEDVMMGNEDADIREHEKHSEDLLACQVCHSTSYINCVNCHVEQTGDGQPFFTVEDNYLGFFIGLNPERTEERPYKYVPMRHVPIDPSSFSYYGVDLLPNFAERPTWVYATPHNIQLLTPQADRCSNCHTNDDVFLTMDNMLNSLEAEANVDVMVEEAPERP